MNFIKTTLIGGVLFLVPVIVLVVVVAEAVDLMMAVAEPVAAVLPVKTVGDIALVKIVAVVAVVLLCFLAGLVAQTRLARKLTKGIEAAILDRIPGYTMFRGMTSGLDPERAAQFEPVTVARMGVQRIGFRVEQVDADRAAIYFPNAPNVWSGVLEIVPVSSVEPIDASVMEVIENIEKMGRGSRQVMSGPTDRGEEPA